MSNFITFILLSGFAIGLALAISFYNVFAVKWGLTSLVYQRKRYSATWHLYSGLLRFLSWALVFVSGWFSRLDFSDAFFISLIYANLATTGYRLLYNLSRHKAWDYIGSRSSGTGSMLDKLLGKGVILFEAVLLVITILWYPLNMVRWLDLLIVRVYDHWWEFVATGMIFLTAFLIIRKFQKR